LGEPSDSWLALASSKLAKVSFVTCSSIKIEVRNCDVVLGAGRRKTLLNILSQTPTIRPTLLFTEGSDARRISPFQGRYFTHERVGGVTTWKGKAWSRDWLMPCHPRTVIRNIGHILSHKDLPRPCKPDPAFRHLSPGDLYPIEGSKLSVVFPTHSTVTNWGHRL
jgi:hypothetical protein